MQRTSEMREPLRAGIKLSLVDHHHLPLIFDLHGAWVKRSGVHHEQTVHTLEVTTTVNQDLRDALMECLMVNLD